MQGEQCSLSQDRQLEARSRLEQAAERDVTPSVDAPADGLRELGCQIASSGLSERATVDVAHADRALVPFGNGGYAVYQVTKIASVMLKTVPIAR